MSGDVWALASPPQRGVSSQRPWTSGVGLFLPLLSFPRSVDRLQEEREGMCVDRNVYIYMCVHTHIYIWIEGEDLCTADTVSRSSDGRDWKT